jgi:hypothetical protein
VKGSYQATSNRFTHFYHFTDDLELRGAGRFVPRESMEDKNNPVWMTKGEWQTVRGNSLVASVQTGRWDYGGRNWGLAPGKVSTTDIATQLIGGNFWAANGLHRDMGRNHTKGVVSYYKPDLWGGNHDFKVGVDHLGSWWADGDIPAGVSSGHPAGENQTIHRLVFNNGARSSSPRRIHRSTRKQRPILGLWAGLVDPRPTGHAQPGAPRRARHGVAP